MLKYLVVVAAVFVSSAFADEDPDAIYVLGPESQANENVPKGRLSLHVWNSRIFPDTTREYQVYIPAQYDGTQPACLMVFQDGHAYANPAGQLRVPVVFDNLIHSGELPVTICVFVNPGHRGSEQPQNRWRASNRSFEYDTLSDQYARFIQQELVPHVVEQFDLNISDDPADRAIGGASSGGICAFTVAWEHPEWFGKVLSHIGSFTNIRGGHVYPALIRKTEPKPIRVYLQDGSNDLDNQHGNWWLSNLQMDKALAFMKYDYKFVAGQGTHSQKHGGAILPDSLRWLWRDHVTGKQPETTTQVDPVDVYEARQVSYTGGDYENESFGYRLMSPASMEEGRKYPLILFLHGAGERGSDNSRQLTHFPVLMAQPQYRERYPCFVLAPQCRTGRKWVEVDWSAARTHKSPATPGDQMQVALQILRKTLQDYPIDADRVYLTGLSMGGYGSWDLGCREPGLFAAVAPICGGADNDAVGALKNMPVWVAHGSADKVVPPERSRLAVAALRAAGGNPIYVELPGVGHNSWAPSYTDNDGLIPWLFRQTRQ